MGTDINGPPRVHLVFVHRGMSPRDTNSTQQKPRTRIVSAVDLEGFFAEPLLHRMADRLRPFPPWSRRGP